ncbi:hypothetical protein, partial [Escherichia coli]
YSAFIRLTARDRVHLANIMRKIRVMPVFSCPIKIQVGRV